MTASPGLTATEGEHTVVKESQSSSEVAIVHDYLTQRGGAERVVLSMLRAFPRAPLVTSLYSPTQTYREFRWRTIQTSGVNRVAFLRNRHRYALPVLAPAFARMRVDADVVLCSSSGWAHGVPTRGRKIVYCYTPARWLYQTDRYLPSGKYRRVMGLFAVPLRRWDRRAAASAMQYLVTSRAVRDRVWQAYGIEADILPPPQSVDVTAEQQPVPGLEPGFFLAVSRLLPYKQVERIVEAFVALPDQRLVVAGSGPELHRIRAIAGPNVQALGAVPEAQLRWLYRNCRALVSASHEDYGLTPLECAAFGRPSVVLRWGGFLDTVRSGETGVFFDHPDAADIAAATRRLLASEFDEEVIRAHAVERSEPRFIEQLQDVVGNA